MQKYSFTRISGNGKTGPIPVTMTARDSCPSNCGLKSNGCYAESGHIRIWWNKTEGERTQSNSGALYGIGIDELCANIRTLPKGQLWRHNSAGDLPHDNQLINAKALHVLTQANKGRQGFTYTHHMVSGNGALSQHNRNVIREANKQGFTVNLSADTLAQADALQALNIGPVVTIMPMDCDKVTVTPAGNTIVQCPATYRENLTCASCGICAVSTRRAIIGFPVHGISKRKAGNVFKGIAVNTIKGNA